MTVTNFRLQINPNGYNAPGLLMVDTTLHNANAVQGRPDPTGFTVVDAVGNVGVYQNQLPMVPRTAL